jgi:hypothetical protein
MKLKFANAEQAKEVLRFQKLKKKLHKTTAAIWYNKACKTLRLTHTYISIKINGNSKRDRNTIRALLSSGSTKKLNFFTTKKQI